MSGSSPDSRAFRAGWWRAPGLMVVAALVLTACSGGAPASQGGEPDEDRAALSQRVNALLTLPEAQRRAELTRMGVDLQSELATKSGLAAELGEGDASAAALDRAWAPMVEGTLALETAPTDLGFQAEFAVSTGSAASTGEGVFAGYMAVALIARTAVTGTNGATDAEMAEKSGSVEGNPRMEVHSARDRVEGSVVGEQTTEGVSTRMSTTFDVGTCPDPNGAFEAKATVDVSVSKGSVGQRTTVDVTVTGTVGEDAQIAALEIGYRAQAGRSSGGRGEFIDLSGTASLGAATPVTVNRSGGTVSPGLRAEAADTGATYGALLGVQMYMAAEAAWKSGRCVRLAYTASPGPAGLEPGSTSSIVASPKSRVDGTPTRGTVTAALSSGGARVAPTSAVPADATFTYTAPDTPGAGGTVTLESRSRRGIGTAEVVLSTGGTYVASGSSGGLTFSGTVASLSAPFTIEIAFPGADSGAFSFQPTDDASGAVSIEARGSGAVVTGGGTYTVTDNPDGTKTVVATVSSCVDVSGECRSGVHPILLTPAG